jgi:hypothetical protein
MLASQRSLASAQIGRNTAAELVESPTPLREATLEAFRRRNAVLDTIFYDVGTVTPDEARDISPWLAREGSLLIVPPSGQGPLRRCVSLDAFAEAGGAEIRVLTVAGVGSSALGSAAFARNVADAFGEPVAAVVSGYGLADLATEALGGWFWFGTLNRMRHLFELLDAGARIPAGVPVADLAARARREQVSLDTRTVCALLTDPRFAFSLLTGHSKGNLVVSEALFALDDRPLGSDIGPRDDAWVVTLSAAVTMPARYANTVDVMGTVDWLGAMNSRPLRVEKTYPLAWHHTNTEAPFHLPVTRVFRELIGERGITLLGGRPQPNGGPTA